MRAFALAMCALGLSRLAMADLDPFDCRKKNFTTRAVKCFSPYYSKIRCNYNLPSNTTTRDATYRLLYYFEDATEPTECTEQKELVTASGRTKIQWFIGEVYYFTKFLFLLEYKVNGSSWKSLHCDSMFADQKFELHGLQWVNVTPTGQQARLMVHWQSIDVPSFYVDYQLEYWTNGSTQRQKLLKTMQSSVEVECQFLDVPYNFHVRARPVPTSTYFGSWGPWSPVAQAMPALVTGHLSMRCFTRDLQQVTCEWTGSNRDLLSNTTFILSHWSRSMNGTCDDVENLSSEDLVMYRCKFGSPAAEKTSVTLRAENWRGWYSVAHRPFFLHQVVEPAAPINVIAAPGPNNLELIVTWSAPILALQYLLRYEIRYSEYGNDIWKLIQAKENSSSLQLQDMVANKTYRVQIRAAPGTPELRGSWGPWSTTAVAKPSPMHNRSRLMHLMAFVPIITIFVGVLLANRNISRIKNWLWPSIPSLNKSFNGLYTEFKGNFEDWLASTWISATRAAGPSDVSACAIEVLSEIQSMEEEKQSKEISSTAEPNDSGHSSCNGCLHPLLMDDLSEPLANGKLYLCTVEKNSNCDSGAPSAETDGDVFELTVVATNPAERKDSCQNLPYI
uniref:thrombopoietin receptor-like n=1 Tax=Myxine glutinosa TaxID=7769 RepID=UPI00358F3F0F